jgi:hypothetical protein
MLIRPNQVYISPKKSKLKFVKNTKKRKKRVRPDLPVKKASLRKGLQSNLLDDFKDIEMHSYNFKSLNSSKYIS